MSTSYHPRAKPYYHLERQKQFVLLPNESFAQQIPLLGDQQKGTSECQLILDKYLMGGNFQSMITQTRYRVRLRTYFTALFTGAEDPSQISNFLKELQDTFSVESQKCELESMLEVFFESVDQMDLSKIQEEMLKFNVLEAVVRALNHFRKIYTECKGVCQQIAQQLQKFKDGGQIADSEEQSADTRFISSFRDKILNNLGIRDMVKNSYTRAYQIYEAQLIQTFANHFELEDDDTDIIFKLRFQGDGNIEVQQQDLSPPLPELITQIQKASFCLIDMQWDHHCLKNELKSIITEQIEAKIEVSREYEEPNLLMILTKWNEQIVYKFFHMVLSGLQPQQEDLFQFSKELVKTKFINLKIEELFTVILEIKEKENPHQIPPSIVELKAIISHKLHFRKLSSQLRTQISDRLLVPGISTNKIVDFYIKLIRILRFLDPSSILLEITQEPIVKYLRSRKDTMRCIVNQIIDEQNPQLYSQFGNPHVQISYEGEQEYISSDEDEEAASKWQPTQINSAQDTDLQNFISSKRRQSDIISTLLNIYGSAQEFIKVYQTMLQERLINNPDINHQQELKNLEHMKLRFGDHHMQQCAVMLKDIKDSERINNDVQNQLKTSKQMYVKVISRGFWPKYIDPDETLEVEEKERPFFGQGFEPSPELKDRFGQFVKEYEKQRRLRTLVIRQNLGTVNLTLSFQNGDFTFDVSPIHAQIISFFGTEDSSIVTLSLQQIMDQMSNQENSQRQMQEDEVKVHCDFWVCKGVLKQVQQVYYQSILEYHSTNLQEDTSNSMDQEQNNLIQVRPKKFGGAPQILQHQKSGNSAEIQNFVMTILRNSLGNREQTLDKIFQMLSTLYMPGKGVTKPIVEGVLQQMVLSGQIRQAGEKFSAAV